MTIFSRILRDDKWVAVIVVLSSLVIGLAIFLDWWPMLRGGFGWRWPYAMPAIDDLQRILPFIFTLLIYLVGANFLKKSRALYYVFWCVISATALPVAALFWLDDPFYLLFTRTISGLTTGGFTIANRADDMMNLLRQWPDLMPAFEEFSSHMTVSPPGWVASYMLVTKGLEQLPFFSRPLALILKTLQCNDVGLMQLSNAQIASAWLGIAAPFWAALAVIPIFDLGRRMASEEIGRQAIAWWPLVPSLLMFVGTLSNPYPLGAVCVFWLFWIGLEQNVPQKKPSLLLIMAGTCSGLLLLFSFAWLPFILFLGLFTLVYNMRLDGKPFSRRLKAPILIGIQFGIGLLGVFVLYTFITGHTPFVIFQVAMQYHLQLERDYWPWLLLHAWDFVLFLGIPATLLALVGFYRTTGRLRTLAISLAITFAITILSGSGRGETGRIWLFFMPFVLLIAGGALAQIGGKHRSLLMASQILWIVLLILVIRTVGTAFEPPPDLSTVAYDSDGQPSITRKANFGGLLYLQGIDGRIEVTRSEAIVDLFWDVKEPIDLPYFFSAVLVSPDGLPVSSTNWQPFDYQFPTTCWYSAAEDQQIVDRIVLPLESPVASGEYWLSLRVFELQDSEAPKFLTVTLPEGGVDDQLGLGPITLEADEP